MFCSYGNSCKLCYYSRYVPLFRYSPYKLITSRIAQLVSETYVPVILKRKAKRYVPSF